MAKTHIKSLKNSQLPAFLHHWYIFLSYFDSSNKEKHLIFPLLCWIASCSFFNSRFFRTKTNGKAPKFKMIKSPLESIFKLLIENGNKLMRFPKTHIKRALTHIKPAKNSYQNSQIPAFSWSGVRWILLKKSLISNFIASIKSSRGKGEYYPLLLKWCYKR